MKIRPATIADYAALCAIDTVAAETPERCAQIHHWLASADCHVAEVSGTVAAYGVLTTQFFGQPFIEMVMVGAAFRRLGLGAAIIRHIQSQVPSSKLFSSTNASNAAMRSMFEKLGFEPSGQIDNLDDGDPELIFFRRP